MYEVFEHTADLGLRVRAADLNALFEEAGRGFFSVIVENLDAVRPLQTTAWTLAGTDLEYLFFDWLNELVYAFDTTHVLLSEFTVVVGPEGLHATGRGEPLDPARHMLSHEVKAVTYHQLRIEQTPDGWLAEVILDI